MPRMQVYLPELLYQQVKESELPVSEILQAALRERLIVEEKQKALDAYLIELAEDVGEPSEQTLKAADTWVQSLVRS